MEQSYCDFCKVPLRQRQRPMMDASTSFIDVHFLPEEELDIAKRNQELLIPLKMQLAEYREALITANGRQQLGQNTAAALVVPDSSLTRLDQIFASHGSIIVYSCLHSVCYRFLLLSIEQSLRGKYRRLEELKQRRAIQRQQMEAISAKRELLKHIKQQSSLHMSALSEKRRQLALRLFSMLPVTQLSSSSNSNNNGDKMDKENNNDSSHTNNPRTVAVTGVSSILSLPLPNNGYLEESPVEQVGAALSSVAAMVDALSTVFNIPLPHPLLPAAVTGGPPMIAPQFAEHRAIPVLPATSLSLRERCRPFAWTPLRVARERNDVSDGDGDGDGGVGDIRSDSSSKKKKKKKKTEEMDMACNPSFYPALALLQADIVSLCLKLGLGSDQLWPAPCLLLNLTALQSHLTNLGGGKSAASTESSSSNISINSNSSRTAALLAQLRERLLRPDGGEAQSYRRAVASIRRRLTGRFLRDYSHHRHHCLSHSHSHSHYSQCCCQEEEEEEDGDFEQVLPPEQPLAAGQRANSIEGEWDLL